VGVCPPSGSALSCFGLAGFKKFAGFQLSKSVGGAFNLFLKGAGGH
jgi:hypothetical protein